ncbi:hypothetical protein PD280_22595 [Virgibacillus salarius]|uniref:hypothetical protein n=1 Tax=Virgibacillus salarius TaxID=447199 RepID=UPI00041960FA|nr:hypothetical protein [Virgibacillus salarius]WBX80321.1 hypothetical protein PD280_22595 [Virgibacillus salarius]
METDYYDELEYFFEQYSKEKNHIITPSSKFNNIIFISDRNEINHQLFSFIEQSVKKIYLGRLDNKRTDSFSDSNWFDIPEGFDNLKGENITVIGTPHLNPIAYLLISVALGYRMGLEESRMEYIPVERNGLRFYFTTYSNDSLLKEVQFYFVESQLLQAIGRARVNRFPAKVLILSNLPVVGAEYISFSQKELMELMK